MTTAGERSIREKLSNRLQGSRRPLPRSMMSPALSYGRHRGPWPNRSRNAAVLIAIFRDSDDQWTIPLTRRPETLKHHGGQICLPGGRVESGESLLDAALREFREELGVQPQRVVHCGELDTQYVYNSDNRVHPVVVFIDRPLQPWEPDPVEVAEVILMPVTALLDPNGRRELTKQRGVWNQGTKIDTFEFRAEMFEHQSHQIWGATAVILDQFARVLSEIAVLPEMGIPPETGIHPKTGRP